MASPKTNGPDGAQLLRRAEEAIDAAGDAVEAAVLHIERPAGERLETKLEDVKRPLQAAVAQQEDQPGKTITVTQDDADRIERIANALEASRDRFPTGAVDDARWLRSLVRAALATPSQQEKPRPGSGAGDEGSPPDSHGVGTAGAASSPSERPRCGGSGRIPVEPDVTKEREFEPCPGCIDCSQPPVDDGPVPDTDDLCTCGHVRHEHHTVDGTDEGEAGRCAHCGCEKFTPEPPVDEKPERCRDCGVALGYPHVSTCSLLVGEERGSVVKADCQSQPDCSTSEPECDGSGFRHTTEGDDEVTREGKCPGCPRCSTSEQGEEGDDEDARVSEQELALRRDDPEFRARLERSIEENRKLLVRLGQPNSALASEQVGEGCERCSHIAAEALAMAEELEGKPLKRRFRSVEEIKREFFPALHAQEGRAAREAEPPLELPAPEQKDGEG